MNIPNTLQKALFTRLLRLPHGFALVIALFGAGLVLGAAPKAFGESTNETITVDGKVVNAATAFSFVPRANNLNAKFRASPSKIVISKEISMKLGGESASELIKTALTSLLFDTGRFDVQKEAKPGQYEVHVEMKNFRFGDRTTNASSKAVWRNVTDTMVKKFGGNAAMVAELAAVDWTKDESRVVIDCGVTVRLYNPEGTLVENHSAEASQDTTVKEVRAHMAGIDFSQNGPPLQNLVEFKTGIVELAVRAALVKMLPGIDGLLATPALEAKPSTAPAIATPATPAPVLSPASAEVSIPRAAFCSQCGTKVIAGGKFCSGCGFKVAQ